MPGTDAQGGPDTTGAGRETADENDAALMRSIIQRIATGPELSKDISRDEARRGMRLVLDGAVDPVRAAVFLIALRMKRETDDENLGILDAVLETTDTVTAPVDEVVDLSDPYNGFNRKSARIGLPSRGARGMRGAGDFARSGVDGAEVRRHPPPRTRGKRNAGRPGDGRDLQPTFRPGCRMGVLRPVRLQFEAPCAGRIAVAHRQAPGADHRRGDGRTGTRPAAHARGHRLRAQAVRRNLHDARAVRGVRFGAHRARHRRRDHFFFPSLRQGAKVWAYHGEGEERDADISPDEVGTAQTVRAVPLPEGVEGYRRKSDETGGEVDGVAIAEAAARAGLDALDGAPGPARDSLVYGAALILRHVGRARRLNEAADLVRTVIDDGRARCAFPTSVATTIPHRTANRGR